MPAGGGRHAGGKGGTLVTGKEGRGERGRGKPVEDEALLEQGRKTEGKGGGGGEGPDRWKRRHF